jgi:hypothetical protein
MPHSARMAGGAVVVGGQVFARELIERIREAQRANPQWTRCRLAREVCQWIDWRSATGKLKEMSCRKALLKLARLGHLTLPAPTRRITFRAKSCERVQLKLTSATQITCIKQIEVVPVHGKELSAQWNKLVADHHDLGYRPLAGAQLRYLIRTEHGFAAALGFRSAALRSKARDRWIGWSTQAREAYIERVVCNARFAIVGKIRVHNFASQVLARVLRRLPQDWEKAYGVRPLLVETYVDRTRHTGSCYRAANWQQVGQTRGGSSTHGRGGREQSRKAILVYPLHRTFRQLLCEEPGPARLPPAAALRYKLELAGAYDRQDWTQGEFRSARFADCRLQRRLCTLARCFQAQPRAPIPQACNDAAGARAAYRFFDRVKMEAILEPHYVATMNRASEESGYVLAVNDTTGLNFTAHPATAGLGPLKNKDSKAQGLWMHSTLLFTTRGTALGLIDAQVWARKGVGKAARRHEMPIAKKESGKWLKSFDAAARLQRQLGAAVAVVHIGDRESDIYEYFVHVLREPHGPHALVRADTQQRQLDASEQKVRDHLLSLPVAAERVVEIPRHKNRAARSAHLQIRFATVDLQAPKRHRQLGSVRLSVIYVSEPNAPNGIEPIEWMLWTTLPVATATHAWEKVEWYKRRWGIEDFHRTLKSGCRIEDRQLTTADRLMSCLAVDIVVAARIEQMKKLSREQPDRPCTTLFSASEMQVLAAHFKPEALRTADGLTLHEAVRYTARLGGFLARKSDGEPGSKTLWRGLERLTAMVLGWQLARAAPPTDGQPRPTPVLGHSDYG